MELNSRQLSHVKRLKHSHGVSVDLDALGVDGTDVRNVVQPSLSLLLLELERNTSDWTSLNTLHQVGGVPGDLVSKPLRLDDGHVVAQTLVGVEVQGHSVVVLLYDGAACALNSLRPNTTLRREEENDDEEEENKHKTPVSFVRK